jgi:L-threonylcarbamoyladenylate synthase
MLRCGVTEINTVKGGVSDDTNAFFTSSYDEIAVKQAADIIKNGGIGAFPTETVYGLGANAFDAEAVKRVYRVKGRPGDNPLILHVNSITEAELLAKKLSETAKSLMHAFWPGPLTLVFAKNIKLPAWVGGYPENYINTVAVRSPNHPMARTLIERSGCIIAAPSANRAGTPSPTCAGHVADDFSPSDIDFLLDGGHTVLGLESTVVDITGDIPVILRPGAVTESMIRETVGRLEYAESVAGAPRSPGQKYRHYAPKAPMTLVMGLPEDAAAVIQSKIKPGVKTGILATGQTESMYIKSENTVVLNMGDRNDVKTIAYNLYACLRYFDELDAEIIYAECIPAAGLGKAIMNRLTKAAEGRVIFE